MGPVGHPGTIIRESMSDKTILIFLIYDNLIFWFQIKKRIYFLRKYIL